MWRDNNISLGKLTIVSHNIWVFYLKNKKNKGGMDIGKMFPLVKKNIGIKKVHYFLQLQKNHMILKTRCYTILL